MELNGENWLRAEGSSLSAKGWGLTNGNWPLDLIALGVRDRRGVWRELVVPPKIKTQPSTGFSRDGTLLALGFAAPLMLLGLGKRAPLVRAVLFSGLTLSPGLLHRAAPFGPPALSNYLVLSLAAVLLSCSIATLAKLRTRRGKPAHHWSIRIGAPILAAAVAPWLIYVAAPPRNQTAVRFSVTLAVFCLAGALLAVLIRHENRLRRYNLACLAAALLCLITLELALRQVPPALWDRALGKPLLLRGRTSVDNFWPGDVIRGKRYPLAKPPGVTRVICFGGSSVYGFPYIDARRAWPALTEAILNRTEGSSGRRWEVINAGMNGFTSFLILETYQRVLAKYQPDIVIVSTRFNDSTLGGFRWFRELPHRTDAQAWRQVDALTKTALVIPTLEALDSLELFRLLRAFVRAAASVRTDPAEDSSRTPRGTLPEFRHHLAEIARFARSHGTTPIFMVEADADGDTLAQAIRRKPYVRAMVEEASRLGVPLIDTFEVLRQPRGQWMFYDYVHPTRLGNELIASELALAVSQRETDAKPE